MTSKMNLCKSHPDFHIPADVVVGEGFDGDAYAARLKKSGVDAVAFFAKCHYGHAYYYTKVGTRHPGLQMDMLAEVVRGCRKHDVGIVAYFSVFLDTAAIERHPDWRVQSERTGVDAGFDSGRYKPVCVNSPYLEELFIPQIVEVLEGYDVDEIFLDTMTGFNPCYCPHCTGKFGGEIPGGPEDENWLDYVKWYAKCYEDFYRNVGVAAHKVQSDVAVTFNWEWGIRRPTTPPEGIDRLAADLISTPYWSSLVTRYFAGTDYPSDYMTGRFLHGLGDWNSNTRESLLLTAASTVANGSGFYMIDRQLPDGTLEERAWEAMEDVFNWLQERREWLCDAHHVPQIAVLHSYSHIMGPKLEHFPESNVRKERVKPIEGVTRLFMEHGRHFTTLSESSVAERAGDYPLLIVPEQEHLPQKVVDALRTYVCDGGTLLLSLPEEIDNFSPDLLDLAGVTCKGASELSYGYFDLNPAQHMRGHFLDIEPIEGTETLIGRVEPMAAGGRAKSFGHGFAPPAGPHPCSAAVGRNVGRGRVALVAAPVMKEYLNHQDPRVAEMYLNLVDGLFPEPLVRIETRAQVEMSTMRKGDDLIVHLVNLSGKERLGYYHYPVTEYIPEIRDIPVWIRAEGELAVTRVPSGEALAGAAEDGYVRVTVPSLYVMESLHVPGYFAHA